MHTRTYDRLNLTNVRTLAAILVVFAHVTAVRADEWGAPRVQNVFSTNGQYFVRIIPPAQVVNGAPSVRGAHGEFYARLPDRSYKLMADVELTNPVSPTYAIVTDEGYFVTFDEWFGIGIGRVIAFYQPTGALIRAVTIEELYAPEKLADIPRSMSSRWWRCGVWYTAPHAPNEESLTVTEHFGGSFTLHPRTGTFDYRAGTATCRTGGAQRF